MYPKDAFVRRGLYVYQLEHWLRYDHAPELYPTSNIITPCVGIDHSYGPFGTQPNLNSYIHVTHVARPCDPCMRPIQTRYFPQEQLLVMNHEWMQDNPEAALRRAVEFLGQDTKRLKPPKEVRASAAAVWG